MILCAKEIESIVFFGIATSGVVPSTLFHASDADYRVVLADCCADLDAELHTVLLTPLSPQSAAILSDR
jgi:nicotinamidase-related amidase